MVGGERGKVFSSRSGCELLAEPLSPQGMGSSGAPATAQRGSCDGGHLTHPREGPGQQHEHSDVVLLMPQPPEMLFFNPFPLAGEAWEKSLVPGHARMSLQGARVLQ